MAQSRLDILPIQKTQAISEMAVNALLQCARKNKTEVACQYTVHDNVNNAWLKL